VASEKSELTYKSLPDLVLITATSLLHALILLLAIVIKDIDIVFELVGSLAAVFITFIFPACGYLMALSKYGTA